MNSIRAYIYKIIPKSWRKALGKSKLLKPIREFFFRNQSGYREIVVAISKVYGSYDVVFKFVSSIQIASKAKEGGIETKLLRNTIQLLKAYKHSDIDDYVVADVGANFGFLSLVWAQSVCRVGKVYSFEPHPNLFQTFCKSIELNDLNSVIIPNNLAVGKIPGSVAISMASTTSNTDKTLLEKHQLRSEKNVEMIVLDHYFKDFKRLDLIKIDVDGIELDILEGAEKILKKLKPIFVVETNGDRTICDFFERNGYTMLDMNLSPFDVKKALPLNIFCIYK